MSGRDYCEQVARCKRIGRTTLVVGVDTGCASYEVGFVSKEGKCWEVIRISPKGRVPRALPLGIYFHKGESNFKPFESNPQWLPS